MLFRSILKQYINDIIISGKMTDEDIKNAKKEQYSILKELQEIKTDLDKFNFDTNNYLNVDVKNTSIPVTGNFYQTTQPVSIASTISTNSNITNSSLDVHIYGVGTGTSQHQLSVDNQGLLNVNLHDNAGNAINSTSNALNSYITNTVAISGSVSNTSFKSQLQDNSGNALNSTSNALNTYITNTSLTTTNSDRKSTRLNSSH